MAFIDSIIGAFSPKAAFTRSRYRLAASAISESQRKFDAAAKTRRTDGWTSSATSPNQETLRVLSTLRSRSRDLVRNNAYAKRAIQAIRNNTIGTGIRPTASVDNQKIKETWWKWAETTDCDYNGKETFYGLQKLIIGAVAQDGEVIIRKRRVSSKTSLPIKLQVCEADQIDDSKDALAIKGGGFIIQGVEFDGNGQVVAYHLYDRHPGDSMSLQSKRIPASEILHIYLQERPGQVRGIPWTSAVMIKLRDFDDFEDAQLMQQKIAACFAAFVTKESETGLENSVDSYEQSERIEPGIIEHLRPGEEVSFSSPPSTVGQETFSRKVLQAVAVGLGISYEELTGDLGNVNFSSGRMGWLAMHRNISEWQNRIMINQFCDPVWNWFIEALKIKSGELPEGIYAEWTPPKREMIDPVKEITGLKMMVENHFSSWQEIIRALGFDPDTVLMQIKTDREKFSKHGITITEKKTENSSQNQQ